MMRVLTLSVWGHSSSLMRIFHVFDALCISQRHWSTVREGVLQVAALVGLISPVLFTSKSEDSVLRGSRTSSQFSLRGVPGIGVVFRQLTSVGLGYSVMCFAGVYVLVRVQ